MADLPAPPSEIFRKLTLLGKLRDKRRRHYWLWGMGRECFIVFPRDHPYAPKFWTDNHDRIPLEVRGVVTWYANKVRDHSSLSDEWVLGWHYNSGRTAAEYWAGISQGVLWDHTKRDDVCQEGMNALRQMVAVANAAI